MATLDHMAKDKDDLCQALEFWRLKAGNNIFSYVKSKNKDRIKAKPSATPESRTSSFGFSQLQYRPISQAKKTYEGSMQHISNLDVFVSREILYSPKINQLARHRGMSNVVGKRLSHARLSCMLR